MIARAATPGSACEPACEPASDLATARARRGLLTDVDRRALDRQLVLAVETRDLGRLVDALTAGADPDTRRSVAHPHLVNTQDLSVVAYAVQSGFPFLVEALLAWGALIDRWPGDPHNVPLHEAVTGRQEAMAVRLLEAGANPRARNTRGESALHVATITNAEAMVRLLLARDPTLVAEATPALDTPLHLAVAHRFLPLVRLLLAAGADPLVPNGRGHTAFHAAVYQGSPFVRSASKKASPACLLALLETGASIAVADAVGCPSVLALAASHGAGACAVHLLRAGAPMTDAVLAAIEHPPSGGEPSDPPVLPVFPAICQAIGEGSLAREAVLPLLQSTRADLRERVFHLLCATPDVPPESQRPAPPSDGAPTRRPG